jgi:nucleoside-diphosphate-sugar epimerase
MDTPNSELMAKYYPSVPLRKGTGERDTLLSIDKARRMLGYKPEYSWRDVLAATATAAAGSRRGNGR